MTIELATNEDAMPVYSVATAPTTAPRINRVSALVAQANTTAEAKALAKAISPDDVDAVWGAATVTDLAGVPDMTGWKFRVQVNTTTPTSVTYTGVAGDTVDTVGTAVAALLAAAGHGTDHAAYNTGTNVLTVASTGDALGDKTITVTVTPPTGLFVSGYSWAQADLVTSKTDGGSSGAALTVQLSTSWLIPGVPFTYRVSE